MKNVASLLAMFVICVPTSMAKGKTELSVFCGNGYYSAPANTQHGYVSTKSGLVKIQNDHSVKVMVRASRYLYKCIDAGVLLSANGLSYKTEKGVVNGYGQVTLADPQIKAGIFGNYHYTIAKVDIAPGAFFAYATAIKGVASAEIIQTGKPAINSSSYGITLSVRYPVSKVLSLGIASGYSRDNVNYKIAYVDVLAGAFFRFR